MIGKLKRNVKKAVAVLVTTALIGVGGYLGVDYATLPTDNKVVISQTSLGLRDETLQVKVLRVVDGDTFEIMYDGKLTKVRLIGVDTPETVKSGTPVQWFGKEASDFTKKTIEDKLVTLEFDKGRFDNYNRLLAYVYLPNSDMLNLVLLHRGYAEAKFYSPNTKYKKVFEEVETQAKKINLGRWDKESQSVWETVYLKKK